MEEGLRNLSWRGQVPIVDVKDYVSADAFAAETSDFIPHLACCRGGVEG